MKRFYIGRLGVNFNEGGYFFTFYWCRRNRMVRMWFRPLIGVTRIRLGFERVWVY